ncbi:MAG: hypothetical protein DRP08_00300 [Candidatus Aenigmatarchaeota archaeon]|nr:MAG: hypothetical protein DRP08_00300 [Candidatus Aenigmarchaeota archaeon]
MKKKNDQKIVISFSLFAIIIFFLILSFLIGYYAKHQQVKIEERNFGKIDIEIIGDCLNKRGCLMVLRNTGMDTINTSDVKIYIDDSFYARANVFRNDYNVTFSHISPNRSVAIRVGNICSDADVISVISLVKTVNNPRVTSWYKSSILCPQNLSGYEHAK